MSQDTQDQANAVANAIDRLRRLIKLALILFFGVGASIFRSEASAGAAVLLLLMSVYSWLAKAYRV